MVDVREPDVFDGQVTELAGGIYGRGGAGRDGLQQSEQDLFVHGMSQRRSARPAGELGQSGRSP